MTRRWTQQEEHFFRNELHELYVAQNKAIGEIAMLLALRESTVHKRLVRLGISITPENKSGYCNKRKDIVIPKIFSNELAEIIGILLGDGSLTHFQIVVTLGNKEYLYAVHVQKLMNKVFNANAKIGVRETGYYDVYFGSVDVSQWLQNQGLVFNKVKNQVDVPRWIFSDKKYMKMCLRGFFDTDGSVYKLKHGIQISFTNYSVPLLKSLQFMLLKLQYSPSCVSSHKVYLTKKQDIERFFKDVKPKNSKHCARYKTIFASVV